MKNSKLILGAVLALIVVILLVLLIDYRDRNTSIPMAPENEPTDGSNSQNREQGQNGTANTSYTTYTDNDLEFQILRPVESDVSTEGEGRIKFLMLGPLSRPNTEITDGFTLTIFRDEGVSTSANLRAYAESRMQSNTANGGEILVGLSSKTINGESAYRYSYKNMLGSTSWEYVFLPEVGTGYTATYTVADPQNRGYEGIILNMLESLTFTP